MVSEITVLDLFSGIGGFSLGLERAGSFRTVAFCERDTFCQAVIRKHWPDTPIYDDVRTIPTDELGTIDLICGGFPCQPWSAAGQQRGAEDDRDLWPAMATLIGKLRPQWVIGENVRGFVNEPMGLQRSLSDLEGFGYQAVPFVIPACAVDAPHRRDRVWIVAHANSNGEPVGTVNAGAGRGQLVADADHAERRRGEVKGSSRDRRPALHGTGRETLAHASGPRLQGAGHEPGEAQDTGTGQPVQLDAQIRGQWLPEPDVGRVANGVPRRVDRLKALGNAVVPQVVEQIGRAIMESDDQK